MSHEDCELVLVDVYWTKAAVCSDTNQFQAGYESYQAEFIWLQKAIQKGLVKLPDIRQVFAWGGLGNGLQSLNQYEKAEECYRKAFLAWENVPGDRKIYVSVFAGSDKIHAKTLQMANMCSCLWQLGKLDEAERLLLNVITDRQDASSFRFVRAPYMTALATNFYRRTGHAMFALGNVQISLGKFDEAYETHSQVLHLFKSCLGIRHHRTGDICHKLGWHLGRMRKYAAAMLVMRLHIDK